METDAQTAVKAIVQGSVGGSNKLRALFNIPCNTAVPDCLNTDKALH